MKNAFAVLTAALCSALRNSAMRRFELLLWMDASKHRSPGEVDVVRSKSLGLHDLR